MQHPLNVSGQQSAADGNQFLQIDFEIAKADIL